MAANAILICHTFFMIGRKTLSNVCGNVKFQLLFTNLVKIQAKIVIHDRIKWHNSATEKLLMIHRYF